jgi:hypothetical protein
MRADIFVPVNRVFDSKYDDITPVEVPSLLSNFIVLLASNPSIV